MALGRRKEAAPRLVRPRLYQQLAEHITAFIEAQGLAPGDRLPPERELAVELGVSRATLAQALVALEMQGRVAVRHGDGAVILDPAERVAAVIAALAGYTAASLESARLPVMAGVLSTAAFGPEELRTAAADAETSGATAAEVWAAVRAAAGVSPLVDIDLALESAGAPIPRQIVAELPALTAALRAGRPVTLTGGAG
ncbi:winged helix-turn-helix domain-containing protein [Nakamurella deserti]|uniref:winged helix-turn-helix domain-containing protein n=1 Tax=Nakamurella deserti TaxID=2164074 RepID=UPI000DBE39C1|nr:winged helix-turn-helix domain-containing protein [Nakamurella deserti]